MSLWLVEHPTPLRFLGLHPHSLGALLLISFLDSPYLVLVLSNTVSWNGLFKTEISTLLWKFSPSPCPIIYGIKVTLFLLMSLKALLGLGSAYFWKFSFFSHPKEKILPCPERKIPQGNHSWSYSPKSLLFLFSARVAFSYQNILPITNDVCLFHLIVS